MPIICNPTGELPEPQTMNESRESLEGAYTFKWRLQKVIKNKNTFKNRNLYYPTMSQDEKI